MISVGTSHSRLLIAVLLAGTLTGAGMADAARAQAQGDVPWTVQGKLLGKPKGPDGRESKKSEDVSGIACATQTGFPRTCLVVDDETQGAQVVILKDGALIAGDFIRLIDDMQDGKLLELDAEAAAYADGAFYVIGSHGRPRQEADSAAAKASGDARAAATRRVFRIRFSPGAIDPATGRLAAAPVINRSLHLPRFIAADARLGPWLDQPLERNGLTIEGLAVRDGMLHAGMRGPVLDTGDAVILSVPLAALFEDRPGEATLDTVKLGRDSQNKPRGIRDLVAFGDGFLVLAGPVNDPPEGRAIQPGDYAVYRYDGRTAKEPFELKGYGMKVKPEALLPLARSEGALRALILFDGPEEGAPRAVALELR